MCRPLRRQLLMTNRLADQMKDDITMEIAQRLFKYRPKKKWNIQINRHCKFITLFLSFHHFISRKAWEWFQIRQRFQIDTTIWFDLVLILDCLYLCFAKCNIGLQIKWHSKRFTLCSSFEWTYVNEIEILSKSRSSKINSCPFWDENSHEIPSRQTNTIEPAYFSLFNKHFVLWPQPQSLPPLCI